MGWGTGLAGGLAEGFQAGAQTANSIIDAQTKRKLLDKYKREEEVGNQMAGLLQQRQAEIDKKKADYDAWKANIENIKNSPDNATGFGENLNLPDSPQQPDPNARAEVSLEEEANAWLKAGFADKYRATIEKIRVKEMQDFDNLGKTWEFIHKINKETNSPVGNKIAVEYSLKTLESPTFLNMAFKGRPDTDKKEFLDELSQAKEQILSGDNASVTSKFISSMADIYKLVKNKIITPEKGQEEFLSLVAKYGDLMKKEDKTSNLKIMEDLTKKMNEVETTVGGKNISLPPDKFAHVEQTKINQQIEREKELRKSTEKETPQNKAVQKAYTSYVNESKQIDARYSKLLEKTGNSDAIQLQKAKDHLNAIIRHQPSIGNNWGAKERETLENYIKQWSNPDQNTQTPTQTPSFNNKKEGDVWTENGVTFRISNGKLQRKE